MTIIRVIDFETTGVDLPDAQVCEVATCDLHLTEKAIGQPLTWLCGVKAMPPEARAVHHISLADCADLDAFDSGRMFREDCDAMAAHNSEFETKFFGPRVPMICTYKAALRVWPNAPAHNNGTLRYWLEDQGKISLTHAMAQPSHRAGPDAYVTAHILLALFNEGVTGRSMVAWTKEPALLPKCPIGKFRGMPWSDVEAGFLGWMLRQPDMSTDLKFNAEREIARRSGETK